MKPELKRTRIVTEFEYWACWHPTHRHKTQKIAEECIAERERTPRKVVNHWTLDKMARVYERHQAGETLRQIGITYGVGPQRISSVIADYLHHVTPSARQPYVARRLIEMRRTIATL